MDALKFLARLQAEATGGFHKGLDAWVDNTSGVARVLTALAETETD
jgi:hypothetical protein